MRKLVLTTLARENLKDVFEFIEAEFGVNSRVKFANKVSKSLNLIVKNPELFPKSELNIRIHKCVITKQSTLYYTYTIKEIKVLSVFDTRQNPSKIKKFI
ncbi:plasmid stabilization system protein ParE [Flavobacterium aquaticum]|uniref:Plasmid stabilization system protein ParE n=1 Tax=Flavobacterium aquaticum TaxID=1236486 RepID=A0A327YJ37_9FLAO|nr:type II toxin-antitoxin system RelE/ParE family toxin [Flavobacterium aquaticum]RAK21004.1 plasmid stabilization system protein ParE [Flavobacterium aquaticum]